MIKICYGFDDEPVVKNHMTHFLLSSNLFLSISLADSAYKTNGNTEMSELGLLISNFPRFLWGFWLSVEYRSTHFWSLAWEYYFVHYLTVWGTVPMTKTFLNSLGGGSIWNYVFCYTIVKICERTNTFSF